MLNARTSAAPGSHIAAIGWALLGTFAFALLLAAGRLFGSATRTPALEVVFFRYLGGAVTMLALLGLRGFAGLNWRGVRGMHGHVYRALCGSSGVACSLYAASNMPFADATAIGLTQGLLVVLLAALFLREQLTVAQVLASMACVVGACIVVFGKSGLQMPEPQYLKPALVGLVGALLVAGEIVLIRTLAVRDTASTVLLYVNCLACIFLMVPVALIWQPITFLEALKLLALGPLAIAAQYFNIRAFRLAPASLLGPIGYSRLIFAALLGFSLFGEEPDSSTWLGGAVLIASGFVLARSHGPRATERR